MSSCVSESSEPTRLARGTLSQVAERFSLGEATVKRWGWLKNRTGEVTPAPKCYRPRCLIDRAGFSVRARSIGTGLGRTRRIEGSHGFAALVRRYRCQQCRLVMTVTTEALLPRKHYGAGTIGLALWLWSVTRWPAAKVRRELSPRATVGAAAATGWASVKRWASEACSGELWRTIGTTLVAGLRHAWVKCGNEFIDRVPMNRGKNLTLLAQSVAAAGGPDNHLVDRQFRLVRRLAFQDAVAQAASDRRSGDGQRIRL